MGMSTPQLPFASWRLKLRDDCEATGKMLAFDAMGDYVLQLFWQRGLEPTVNAIIGDGPDLHKDLPV